MSESELNLLREEVILVCQELEMLTLKKDHLFHNLQQECRHESVIERPYYTSGFDHTHPPRRICVICTLEEEGWGSGFRILTAQPIRTINEEDFNAFRKKLHPLTMVPIPT